MYKLLIIEDDAAIAGAIAALAASWEMETHIVSDFRAVLTEYAAFSPHIVLVDISLPFFSYGGSSMISCWLAIGLVMAAYRQNESTLSFDS